MTYRVLFFGNWGLGLSGLEGLLACENVEIVKVYTKWDKLTPNPFLNLVHDRAVREGLPVFNSDKALAPLKIFAADILSNERIDFIVSCCYDRIFKPNVLAFPRLPLNVHPSLLPRYRGIKPLENAVAQGEKKVGVTMHELVEALDEGAILLQEDTVNIHDNDTFSSLFDQQAQLAKAVIVKFFQDPEYYIEHKTPQNHSLATLAPRMPFEIQQDATVLEIQLAYRDHLASGLPTQS
ncbi:hypothetical protein AUC43_19720 [Hymenobacter sedentarius]|uniref:Formyl transferase N-terminal domain-containing protein n=1 Tax=Hymenobacter sedentarius TaxID=1411621 RepID=A0A0U4C810_9BACT|nr:formyltransferase family protein [Hymenobacter sedentarius]ALW87106.1 hypothetical protein AUC43_19720 [Hymenobacter sedentarius]